jgi:hypothetical protein
MTLKKEIKELKELFMKSPSTRLYAKSECELFAKVAIEGGYKYKKCFNIDHIVFGREIKK